MGAPEERALTEDPKLVTVCTKGAKHRKTINSLPDDHERTGSGSKALKRVTRLHAALALAAVQLIVITVLAGHIAVLMSRQCSEQNQTECVPSKSAAAVGKDGEVLPPCGDDWIWHKHKCFYFSEDAENWTVANDSCTALHSSLAMIDTKKELDFMLRHKGKFDHWIGLQREIDQPWKWVNGTEFSNWFSVEDHSECAYLNHGKVKSAECYSKRNWICTKVAAYERKRKKRSLFIQHFR